MRFADIAGHEAVKDLLLRVGRRDRVPHAFLFHGPEGVGKYSTAMAFLSWLCCRNRTGDDSCGTCVPCRQIGDGSFPDLKILRPDGAFIKIEQVRDAFPSLYFDPLVGPWKAVVLDDAASLKLEAANAALKTLEEPPSRTVFFLVTPTPDVLPRTVVSRCFGVPFGPVPTAAVIDLLLARGVADEAARSAAVRSRGIPARAIRLAADPLEEDRVPFVRMFLALIEAGPAERLAFSADASKGKDEEAEATQDLLESVLQDVLLAASGAPDGALRNADLAADIREFATRLGPDRAAAAVEAWLDHDADRRFTPTLRLAIDRLVLGL